MLDSTNLINSAVEFGATNPPGHSRLHGQDHWKSVAIMGIQIARITSGADPEFIAVFAQLHDICRLNDDVDPNHGQRAALLFIELVVEGRVPGFAMTDQRTLDLYYALANHVGTPNASCYINPNVGICWDADRLNLWRVGREPDPDQLSTHAARMPHMRLGSHSLCWRQLLDGDPTWLEIETDTIAAAKGPLK